MMDMVFSDTGDAHGGFYDANNGLDNHVPVAGGAVAPRPLDVVHVSVEMAPIAKARRARRAPRPPGAARLHLLFSRVLPPPRKRRRGREWARHRRRRLIGGKRRPAAQRPADTLRRARVLERRGAAFANLARRAHGVRWRRYDLTLNIPRMAGVGA
jgi:hypothetical protein